MYSNMVFDLGGVVINYSPKDFLLEKFFSERKEKYIYDSVFGSEEWLLLDKGQLTWREACEKFMLRAYAKDIAFEMRTVLDEWTDMLTVRKATVNLIKLMKKKDFKIYYLSNMSKDVLALLKKQDYWQLFDGGIASCDVGIIKPDPEIYKLLIDKYSLIPQETIFADDRKENTAAAFEAGITSIQFKNVKSFCKMLVTYGIDL